MRKPKVDVVQVLVGSLELRLFDLIVRTAHVRRKDALRVLKALELLARGYELDPADILGMPMEATKPSIEQRRQCETAYLWLYENEQHRKPLFEIEQLV